MPAATPSGLVERLRRRVDRDVRFVLGITGGPGSGKSTLATALRELLEPDLPVSTAPMDGFHLSNRQLDRRGLRDRKGAPETFDARGYAELLHRIRTDPGPVFAPDFDRTLDEPIAAVHEITAGGGLVITEGNYLALPVGDWPAVRREVDELWFIDTDADVRAERCVARHMGFGRSRPAAIAWVDQVDLPNGALADTTRHLADVVVRAGDLPELGL